MTKLRTFLDRLAGGRRPPTGPLTTDEENEAEALRKKALSGATSIEHGPADDEDSGRRTG